MVERENIGGILDSFRNAGADPTAETEEVIRRIFHDAFGDNTNGPWDDLYADQPSANPDRLSEVIPDAIKQLQSEE